MTSMTSKILNSLFVFVFFGLGGCLDDIASFPSGENPAAYYPVPFGTSARMKIYGMDESAPIMMRIFKEENTLEVWKQAEGGRYGLLQSFDICAWSGDYGPKFREGDKQAPEGFYNIKLHQLNPNSSYHLSFNMGYPNTFDKAHGRTGAHLMVHGDCSSAGCYSMTDDNIEIIYALARDALNGGQESFQVQAFPFRMTPKNMFVHRDSEHIRFWRMLKQGYDHFELTHLPPKVDVCDGRYVFNTYSNGRYSARRKCPTLRTPSHIAEAYTELIDEHRRRYELFRSREFRRSDSSGDISLFPWAG